MNILFDLAMYAHKYIEAISSVALGTDQIKYYISIKWSIMNLKEGLYVLTRKDTRITVYQKKKSYRTVYICVKDLIYTKEGR